MSAGKSSVEVSEVSKTPKPEKVSKDKRSQKGLQVSVEEALYTKGPAVEKVLGIPVTIVPITGEEYTGIIDLCVDGTGKKLNRKKYVRLLISQCVKEPQLDVTRLNPAALAILITRIEEHLGVGEEARKNLRLR